MNEIVFVTHNKGKIASANKQLEGVNFKVFEYELEEPRSDDIKYISKYKVMEAYKIIVGKEEYSCEKYYSGCRRRQDQSVACPADSRAAIPYRRL